MTRFFDESFVYQLWLDFLTHAEKTTEIRAIADRYPDDRSIEFDFNDIFHFNGDLAEVLLDQPEMAIRLGESAVYSLLEPDQKDVINVRVKNLYKQNKVRIRDIRANKLSKFISLEGEVKRVTEVRPKLLSGVFSCTSCGYKQELVQDSFNFTEPLECSKDDGGCGKKKGSTTFKFNVHESRFIDSQKIMIQELREDLRGNQQPETFEVYLEDDLCGLLDGGEVVIMNGVVKAKAKQSSTTFDTFFQCNNIEMEDVRGYEVEYTQEEIDSIIEKLGPNRMKTLIASFCTSIMGMNRVKQGFIYQQVGGTKKFVSGGKQRKNVIHIALIGDPGTAKSTLGEFACSLQPGSVIVDADNPTVPTLTATATKDEFSEGRWFLEPGAFALAHERLFMWDEFHLAHPTKVGVLHRPMEAMEYTSPKAGIIRTYKSEFGAIFIANPSSGRFYPEDKNRPLIECIDIKKFTEPLRDRIDLWFRMINDMNRQQKEQMVLHILKDDRGEVEPPLSMEELMKFFAYCRTFNPRIPDELDHELSKRYCDASEVSMIYNRHLRTIICIAEANAKIFNRDEVIMEDIDLAFNMVMESLRVVTADVDGKINLDAMHTGMGKNQKMRAEIVMDVIKQLDEDNDWAGAGEIEVETECIDQGITDWKEILDKLWNRGLITLNRNKYKVVK